ncbi:MFS transporter [Streptosporangium minutum]|uniref:MFS transporter n=1 Tax=Streptosporangium minutum TaxID=569862 RepID=A0A243R8T1_9ACTN|nr:MFS transporter [Streptosporangium minutum]OUC90978.1 MFS transporter [Streptosporangium minutum]
MTAGEVPTKAGRREWLGLAVLALPTFVVAIDLFVLLLALPNLATDLGANSTQQLWIMDMYGFLLAGFLVTMGTLGDRIGRRKLLLIGAAAFGVASLLTAYSTNPGMLIVSRALLGVAGATLGPSCLALIVTMFQDAKQRAAAFGVWGGTFTLGALLGPVIGGVLLTNFWWGSVFLLGVPVMVIVLIAGPKLLPEFRNSQAGRLDLTSVALSLVSMLALVYGIKQLVRDGWEVLPVVAVVAGLVAGVAFVRRQNRLDNPLLDLQLFKNRAVGTALIGQLSYSSTGGGMMLFMMFYLQLVQGMSTLQAGLALIPGMAAATLGFQVGPKLANRFRPAYVIAAGMAGIVAVLLVFTQVGVTSGTATLIIGFAVLSFCGAPLIALGTNLVVGSAPPEKAGSAGSLTQLSTEFGGTLGIAILGTIGTAVYRNQIADTLPAGIPAPAAAAAGDSLAAGTAAASQLPEPVATSLLTPAYQALVDALHSVSIIGAVLIGIVAVMVAVRLRHVPPVGQAAPEAPPADPAPATESEDTALVTTGGSASTVDDRAAVNNSSI